MDRSHGFRSMGVHRHPWRAGVDLKGNKSGAPCVSTRASPRSPGRALRRNRALSLRSYARGPERIRMGQLVAIQILRAAAAAMVAFGHAQADATLHASRHGLPFERSFALPWGAGVDLFFVISGF